MKLPYDREHNDLFNIHRACVFIWMPTVHHAYSSGHTLLIIYNNIFQGTSVLCNQIIVCTFLCLLIPLNGYTRDRV